LQHSDEIFHLTGVEQSKIDEYMKRMKLIFASIGVVMASFLWTSCSDDDGYSLNSWSRSLATVAPLGNSKSYYLTLDHGTTLWPAATSIPWYTPKEKHRAVVWYTLLSDAFEGYDHAVKVLDIQDILTKPVAKDLGEENDSHYGNDPVKIKDMWIGDGYLNVEFGFNYGGSVKHFINLVERDSVDTPNYFEFRHHAYDDGAKVGHRGLVSFDLSSLETDGEEIQLTIHVKTFEGDKDYTIKYNPDEKKPSESTRSFPDDFVEIS
jgi:hypothetical protein